MNLKTNIFTSLWKRYLRDRLSKGSVAILSFFVHLVLVMVAGSVAFFTVREPLPDLTASEGLISTPTDLDIVMPPSPATGVSPQFDAAPALPALSAIAPLSSITTNAPSTFTMPKVDVAAPTKGLIVSLKSASQTSGLPTGNLEGFQSSGGKQGTGDSAFGSVNKKQDNVFTGKFYDLKQTADKKPVYMEQGKFRKIILEFCQTWDTKLLESYYQSKRTLTTPQIFIPEINAAEAPKAFGVEKEVAPSLWAVIYQGSFSTPESGEFRFVGRGDDLILVRLNGKFVLDGSLHALTDTERAELNDTIAGPWITLEKGKNCQIEVLIAEVPGGFFTAWLNIEKKNGRYNQRPDGKGNRLPVFQLSPAALPPYEAEKGNYAKIPTMAKEGMVFPKTHGL